MHTDDSAKTTATKIAQGHLQASEVLQTCLARVQQYNPAVNAVVTLATDINVAATQADAQVRDGQALAALHGVPVTIKDCFATAGLLTTSSHPPLRAYVPEQDATVVARLKAAGAIVVGKTNLPQLAGDSQCWSPLFGTTNNPWNLALTSGGSSGGSAAAVAMGFSFLDLGSDIGGSIRIPAAYCGVLGLKTTENRIPRTGHIPHLPGMPRTVRHMLSLGLLARHVEDLSLGLEILDGADGVDLEVPPVMASKPVERGDRPLRVAWWDDFAGLPLCARTRRGLMHTVDRLRQAGVQVERCRPADFDFVQAWQAYGLIAGTEIGLGMPSMERRLLRALGTLVPRQQWLTHSLVQGMGLDLRRYNQALEARERLTSSLEGFLQSWDAWLCPVAATVAYAHSPRKAWQKPASIQVDAQAVPYYEACIGMTAPFSLTGSPVVSMPAGVVDGLPVGLQWVGRRWRDEALLQLCAEVEPILGGCPRPPLLAQG
jgi:amidase